jgi:hypothetical protein
MEIDKVIINDQEFWHCHARYLHFRSPKGEKGHLHTSAWEASLCAEMHEEVSMMFDQLAEGIETDTLDRGDLSGLSEFLEAIDESGRSAQHLSEDPEGRESDHDLGRRMAFTLQDLRERIETLAQDFESLTTSMATAKRQLQELRDRVRWP